MPPPRSRSATRRSLKSATDPSVGAFVQVSGHRDTVNSVRRADPAHHVIGAPVAPLAEGQGVPHHYTSTSRRARCLRVQC